MKIIDAHTHLQFAAFDSDREAVIKRAREAGIGMVNVGTQKNTSKKAVELAEKYEGLWATVGLHPIHTEKSYHDPDELGGGKGFESRGEEFDYEYYKRLAQNPKVVAVGECGLDYYRLKLTTSDVVNLQEKQKTAFTKQIELSKEVKKPLMIHCREAFPDLINILNSYFKIHNSDNPGIIHFFSGSLEDAKTLADLGFYFTFGGVITFSRDYDAVINFLPFDRILAETDAPYVAPKPHRGKRNEPLYVAEVVKKLAAVKGLDLETALTRILQNTKNVLSID